MAIDRESQSLDDETMLTPFNLNLVGLSLNLLGTVIAAFSGAKYLRFVDLSVSSIEMTIHALLNPQSGPIPHVTGLEKHRESTGSSGKRWLSVGLFLIAIGFIAQIAALFLQP